MSEKISKYDEMPLAKLVGDYELFAQKMAGEDRDHTDIRGTGLVLRAYMYMFTMGPLRQDQDRLPEPAADGLERVANACLRVLKTSHENDEYGRVYSGEIPALQGEDGETYHDMYEIIFAAQSGLESAQETPQGEFLEQLKENEFLILSGQVDPEVSPIRRMIGLADPTKEAVRDLALTAGEQFGVVAGGMEFLIPDEDQTTWNDYKNQLAGLMRSEWQNPGYVEPVYENSGGIERF